MFLALQLIFLTTHGVVNLSGENKNSTHDGGVWHQNVNVSYLLDMQQIHQPNKCLVDRVVL